MICLDLIQLDCGESTWFPFGKTGHQWQTCLFSSHLKWAWFCSVSTESNLDPHDTHMESDFEGLVRNTHMSNPIGGHVVELWECSSSSFLHKLAHTLLLLCQSLKWACPTATMYQPSPGISSLMRQCQKTGSWTTCVNWMGCIYHLMVPVVTRT